MIIIMIGSLICIVYAVATARWGFAIAGIFFGYWAMICHAIIEGKL